VTIRLSDQLRTLTRLLADAGLDSPRVDAELLASYVLGVPRGRLLLIDDLTAEQAERLVALARQRAARVPLQHITGTAPFGELDLMVGPGVFVPRPETELLARWGLAAVSGVPRPTVVDLCGGSGALALAVAAARPDAQVYAVEISPQAFTWLHRNAEGSAVKPVFGDAVDPATLADLDGRVDLVLSNPPYVPVGTPVPQEVAAHDPALAVFGGSDGLEVIRPLVTRAARLLRSGGLVGVEHDETHTAAMAELLAEAFGQVTTHDDLAGRPRFTTARRRS
jgi:release factor glutamine methyltransferase